MMRDDKNGEDVPDQVELLIPRLVKAAEISEEQARELVEMLGTDWPSLLREARFL
jgi:polyhydroxyalkanoate synthesis regulator phasin